MLKQQAKIIARFVYFLDLALTSVAFLLAFLIRDLVLPKVLPRYFPTGLFPLSDYLAILPLVLIMWSMLLFSHHSYHSHRTVPLRKEVLTTLRVIGIGTVLLATVAYLVPLDHLSRSWFLLFAVLSALFLVLERIFLRLLARYVRARGLNYRTILVVGTGRRAREIVATIEQHKYWGFKILGFVSDGHRLENGWNRFPVLGTLSDLRALIEK